MLVKKTTTSMIRCCEFTGLYKPANQGDMYMWHVVVMCDSWFIRTHWPILYIRWNATISSCFPTRDCRQRMKEGEHSRVYALLHICTGPENYCCTEVSKTRFQVRNFILLSHEFSAQTTAKYYEKSLQKRDVKVCHFRIHQNAQSAPLPLLVNGQPLPST